MTFYPDFVTEHNVDDYDRWISSVEGTEYHDPNTGVGAYGFGMDPVTGRSLHDPRCCCSTCDPAPEPDTDAEILAAGDTIYLRSPNYCDRAPVADSPF